VNGNDKTVKENKNKLRWNLEFCKGIGIFMQLTRLYFILRAATNFLLHRK